VAVRTVYFDTFVSFGDRLYDNHGHASNHTTESFSVTSERTHRICFRISCHTQPVDRNLFSSTQTEFQKLCVNSRGKEFGTYSTNISGYRTSIGR